MPLKKLFKNLDLALFYLFIFLIPFKISLFLGNINKAWTFYNDFIGFWICLSDILIIAIIIFGWQKIHVLDKTKNREAGSALITFFIWTVLSRMWAVSSKIALYRVFLLLAVVFLFFYIKEGIARNIKSRALSYFSLFLAGIIQSIIGIWQFIQQKSIGLPWIGESAFTQSTAGIAKINYNGGKIIRAYGTFPHPNMLGGFLLLAIVCGILLFLLNNSDCNIPIFAGIAIIFTCFVLTFSRSAWLAGGLMLICFAVYLLNKKRRQIANKTLQLAIFTAPIIFVFLIFISPLIKNRFASSQETIADRGFAAEIAFKIIKQEPFLGIGWGNFIPKALDITQNQAIELWQIQPVHNIYLLVFAELGAIGLLFFLIFLAKLLKQSFPQIKNSPEAFLLFSLFCGFLIIGIFDHYFLTLPQGMIIFWLSAGLISNPSMHDH